MRNWRSASVGLLRLRVAELFARSPDGESPSHSEIAFTLAFLTLALLDAFVETRAVSGTWWLVLALVWVLPWPNRLAVAPESRLPNSIGQLLALAVFAWLYFRANGVIRSIFLNWTFAAVEDPWSRFEILPKYVLVSIVSATLFARPIHRAFGRQAAKAVFVMATPYLIWAFAQAEWVPGAWDYSLYLFSWLCGIALSPLVLAQCCHHRIQTGHRQPMRHLAHLRSAIAAIVQGRFGVLYTSLALIGAATAFIGAAVALYGAILAFGLRGGSLTLQETIIQCWDMALTLSTVLLTMTLVGLIRALRRKDFRIGRLQVYGRFTEWLAAIFVLTIPWVVTLLHAAPEIGESAYHALRYFPGVSAPAWRITYEERTATLRLSGQYLPGVAAAFANQLTTHRNTKVVELDGPGGRSWEALRIGELIAARNLATSVQNSCSSACSLAFAGGQIRTMSRDARLGFHAGVAPSAISQWHADSADVDRYLMTRGFSQDFISAVNAIPSNEMWYPSVDQLYKAGVLTAE